MRARKRVQGSRDVLWRGVLFRVERGGRMEPVGGAGKRSDGVVE